MWQSVQLLSWQLWLGKSSPETRRLVLMFTFWLDSNVFLSKVQISTSICLIWNSALWNLLRSTVGLLHGDHRLHLRQPQARLPHWLHLPARHRRLHLRRRTHHRQRPDQGENLSIWTQTQIVGWIENDILRRVCLALPFPKNTSLTRTQASSTTTWTLSTSKSTTTRTTTLSKLVRNIEPHNFQYRSSQVGGCGAGGHLRDHPSQSSGEFQYSWVSPPWSPWNHLHPGSQPDWLVRVSGGSGMQQQRPEIYEQQVLWVGGFATRMVSLHFTFEGWDQGHLL